MWPRRKIWSVGIIGMARTQAASAGGKVANEMPRTTFDSMITDSSHDTEVRRNN